MMSCPTKVNQRSNKMKIDYVAFVEPTENDMLDELSRMSGFSEENHGKFN